jgi:hypothetical protein
MTKWRLAASKIDQLQEHADGGVGAGVPVAGAASPSTVSSVSIEPAAPAAPTAPTTPGTGGMTAPNDAALVRTGAESATVLAAAALLVLGGVTLTAAGGLLAHRPAHRAPGRWPRRRAPAAARQALS